MKLRTQTFLLSMAAIISFADVFLAPKESDPGPWAAAGLGLVLLRRVLIRAQQPAMAILSGCFLTILLVAGNHGLLNVNRPVWLGLIITAGICYAFWEKIARLGRDAVG